MGQILNLCPICHMFQKDCKCNSATEINNRNKKSESMMILEHAIEQAQKNHKFKDYTTDQVLEMARTIAIMDVIAMTARRSK